MAPASSLLAPAFIFLSKDLLCVCSFPALRDFPTDLHKPATFVDLNFHQQLGWKPKWPQVLCACLLGLDTSNQIWDPFKEAFLSEQEDWAVMQGIQVPEAHADPPQAQSHGGCRISERGGLAPEGLQPDSSLRQGNCVPTRNSALAKVVHWRG